MSRRPLVAGNWKMFKTRAEARAFAEALRAGLPDGGAEIAVCPPFTAIESVSRAIVDTQIRLGAQNMSENNFGAHTGEICAGMLKEFLVRYVILGHSERRADDAVRDVMAWLKCEYLQDRVGEEFPGVISGVAGFGLFIEIGEIFADGLVHVSNLQNDYYTYDASGQRLIGERTRRVYRLGDRVRVQVMRVDLDERKIDLQIVEEGGGFSVVAGSKRPSQAVPPSAHKGNKGPRGGPRKGGRDKRRGSRRR